MAGIQDEVGDHNYVGRQMSGDDRDASSDSSEQPIRRGRLRGRRGRMQILENSDHDYLATGVLSGSQEANDERPAFGNELLDDDQLREEDEEVAAPPAEYEELEANNADVDNAVAPPVAAAHPLAERASTSANSAAAAVDTVDITSPVQPKKRKRASKSSTPRMKANRSGGGSGGDADLEEDEDEGFICPICLDNWEMSGDHRLVALRCGHLFGDACIRRWLNESARQSGIKACPQCKTKATAKDIRCLYAKRLRAIDRSEEHRLRDQLDDELRRSQSLQTELSSLKMSYTLVTTKIQTLEVENERMKLLLRTGGGGGFGYVSDTSSDPQLLQRLQSYKLFLERNIDITREPGCRVMVHADQNATMIVSQKSTQSLFPGYGLRFIDTPTFRPTNFLHASARLVRDITLSADQQLVAVASMEPRSKLFDMRTPQTAASVFAPSEKAIWSCALGRAEREHFLYMGSQHGSTYLYDTRQPDWFIDEFKTDGDLSPVINVACMPPNKLFPGGGFIVCKLQSLWFYEYTLSSNTATPTRLSVEGSGPYIAMNFDAAHETLLVSVRSNARHPQSRYLLGQLSKIDDMPVFDVKVTFMGSKTTPVMTRCTQIAVEANTLIAGYIQDVKLLALFDARREARMQSLPVQEVVYDTCPVYTPSATYLAALTENKCRIYKLTPTS